jgi:hypothetical protein
MDLPFEQFVDAEMAWILPRGIIPLPAATLLHSALKNHVEETLI